MTPLVVYNGLNVRPGVDDGAATVSVNLLAHLPEVLPEVRFVAFLQEGESRVPPHERLDVVHRPAAGPLRRVAFETLLLSRELRRLRADLLLAPYESLPLRPPCPVVVIAQNLLYHAGLSTDVLGGLTPAERVLTHARKAYYRRRMPRTFSRAARVVAVSDALARTLQRRARLDPHRTRVVLEGSDSLLLPEPVAAPPAREHALLVVSALAPYKNLVATLEVFERLRDEDPALRLWLAGADWRGYGRVLAGLVRERGLLEHVDFLGAVAPEGIAALYERSRVLLLLSECESFGLPALEAMRFGLPVVVADRAALPEVVGAAGIVVDPDDVAGVTARIRELLLDGAQQERRAALGRSRASELTWRATADGVAAALREALWPDRSG